ncbi:axonal fasciculation [Desmophyllum pertusum]|uniref:Axonal fasciculation n=1 Tax=Desmophyllum pertusum TaxID=174260 RepID=A0A9X0CU82_9CNID|nr:axonal fasciculation [Desmophyllum pertusum]
MNFSCQVTGENFQYWETPAKPAREGEAAIPSVRIPLSQTTGTRKISANDVVGNTQTVELTIDPVTLNDGGDYICQGDSNSAVFTLQVDFENGQVKPAQELHLGKKETIELGVSAYPLLTYEWEKDGIPLTFSGKTLDPYTGSITIDSVQESDEGTYKCKIIFTGSPTSEATNNIVVTTISEPKIRKYQGDPVTRRLTQGNNVTFHCDVESGHPTPVVTWWYGWVDQSKKVDKTYDDRFSHPTYETWTITGIEPKDKEDFRCIAENKAGTADLKFQIIAVDVSPKIDPMEDEIIKNEQEQVDIECVVSGDPTPIVEWFHHGSYYPGQTTLMRGDKKVAKISFPNIHIYNTGDYTCQAKNGATDSAGQVIVVKETVKLYVRSAPKIDKIASPTPVYSFVGITRAVTVTCTFSGYPVLTVRMYSENGTEIARGNTTASYTLKTTTEEDFGKFNCTAENPDGKAAHLMELKKAVRPGPPRNVAANKTCKEIILKWQHPLENGGMEILNYIITVLLDGSQLNTENADGASVQHKIRLQRQTRDKI